ncbi:MAG: AAA family ATPase [Pirellulaceae bacterium]|nr:AAA family ATPase [Pirellulaceae bacterium]
MNSGETLLPHGSDLVQQLLDPIAYRHHAPTVQLCETHISWVFLAGDYAYKVKKPLNFGFADFTTLAKRLHYCQEEVRRNKRYSHDLYLDVVPIVIDNDHLVVGGTGTAVEYAVRMWRFEQSQLAGNLVAANELSPLEFSELATQVAQFHRIAATAQQPELGIQSQIRRFALDNIGQLQTQLLPGRRSQLDSIDSWTRQKCQQLSEIWRQRKALGHIRECHGDLHLGNLIRWQGRLMPFDCIEFNPELYWIDVMNEIAFLIMDLCDHRRSDLGWRFLDGYLESSGDYSGLSVLPFYLVYRAMVRAKVCQLRWLQKDVASEQRERLIDDELHYLEMAWRFTHPPNRTLTITHGVSGSGKTYGTQRLVEQCGYIRIRSDVERKRLFGLLPTERPSAGQSEQMYSSQGSLETYQKLEQLAEQVLVAGFPVVIDATFLRFDQRQRFHQLAARLAVPYRICPFTSDVGELKRRIAERNSKGNDASDADQNVLAAQLQANEPLTVSERQFVVDLAQF